MTAVTFDQRRHLDLDARAVNGVLKVQIEIVAQVCATKDVAPGPTGAAENIAEDIIEDVTEVRPTETARSCARSAR